MNLYALSGSNTQSKEHNGWSSRRGSGGHPSKGQEGVVFHDHCEVFLSRGGILKLCVISIAEKSMRLAG